MDAAIIHGVDGFEPALAAATKRIDAADKPGDLDDLADLMRTRDVDDAAEMLARGMFLAELLGRLEVVEEDQA